MNLGWLALGYLFLGVALEADQINQYPVFIIQPAHDFPNSAPPSLLHNPKHFAE